jgi:transcriptional regulator with XRE-family HTH domain
MAQRRQLSPAQRQVLGANLVEARTKAGITTAAQAAAVVSMTGPRLSLWETGQITPELSGLIRLCVLYRCTLDFVLSGVDQEYTAIAEASLAPDVKHIVRSRLEGAMAQLEEKMRELRIEAGSGQTPATGSALPRTARDKSATPRARRKPPK